MTVLGVLPVEVETKSADGETRVNTKTLMYVLQELDSWERKRTVGAYSGQVPQTHQSSHTQPQRRIGKGCRNDYNTCNKMATSANMSQWRELWSLR